jgi:hypothetical protein
LDGGAGPESAFISGGTDCVGITNTAAAALIVKTCVCVSVRMGWEGCHVGRERERERERGREREEREKREGEREIDGERGRERERDERRGVDV